MVCHGCAQTPVRASTVAGTPGDCLIASVCIAPYTSGMKPTSRSIAARSAIAFVGATLATPATADFFGWIDLSFTVQHEGATLSVVDLYALFSDKADVLLGVDEVTITPGNLAFVHDDARDGTWQPQLVNGFGELDSFVTIGDFVGPGSTTEFAVPPTPDQPAFPPGLSWFDATPELGAGQAAPLPFINFPGVRVARFVIALDEPDLCEAQSPRSAIWVGTVVYSRAGGDPVEIALPHLMVFATAPSPFDLNGDGVLDGADVGVLLARWGSCDLPCSADFTGDDIVDGADLGALLGAWPACR